ncbi:Neutral ceramidase precursor, putative [Pediculus humanus corporis]|uniref:Neutral ceramidase n=1 Tax=Pediculus humanus subsp. corporis TaxID=121224 RepID=E0VU50_PEDHC|nr:Neutral ceramidase precursor, putative [Pediculus humanus corporis]EEB16906.1 Neutral ceramidase precursor, putative [Pediculus humanus corporis]
MQFLLIFNEKFNRDNNNNNAAFFLSFYLFLSNLFLLINGEYDIGVGIADVTGPITDINFMGYGKFEQVGKGLHLRQWARSYIIDDGNQILVFVNVDVGMIGDGLRLQVLKSLKEIYGDAYNSQNVIISGTHTHSAPGGFLMHFLFDLPCKGFSRETFDALVDGIVKSISMAHLNKKKGNIFISKGHLYDTNMNRSPTAYLENPEWERALYQNDTDTEMIQLKFISNDNVPMGVINWFPVHPTSMNNTNTLVSSDNVGYASIKFEKMMNPNHLLGNGPFVASFASTNLGDVSPNIRGPKCQKTGSPCNIMRSTCEEDVCIASGPGKDMFESTAIIADRLFQKARELWGGSSEKVSGPVKIIHQYVDMPKAEAEIKNAEGKTVKVKGCPPAMGYSFAAGTVDGPGAFSFKQGTLSTNPTWNIVRNILASPTENDILCQAPKPILLATGRMKYPFDWQPSIVSTQLALIGNVALIAVPGEFTTMSGRRMKKQITKRMMENGLVNPWPIIAGLSNTYSDYITTFEEYQVQRYEGASTIFGPHTLTLYLNQYDKLLNALFQNKRMDSGPEPQDLLSQKFSFITPVVYDFPKIGYTFGAVLEQPVNVSGPGTTVRAKFLAGNPRNNLMHGKTYCTIERLNSENKWMVVATDADWETKIKWSPINHFTPGNSITVEWTVPDDVTPGIYRIRHFGHSKHFLGRIFPYSGTSDKFQVTNLHHPSPPLPFPPHTHTHIIIIIILIAVRKT